MKVKELMVSPARTCRTWQSVNEAARLMWDHDIGAVPIIDDNERLVGIVTDRDVGMAAYTQGRPIAHIPVGEAMAKTVYTCKSDESVGDALDMMHTMQVRRLPVVDGERRVMGMISLDDAMAGESGGARRKDKNGGATMGSMAQHARPPSARAR